MKMQLIEYETWGNAEDGYDVNDVYKTDIFYDIGASDNDEDIIWKFKNEKKKFWGNIPGSTHESTWLKADANVHVDWLSEEMLEITETKTGMPIGRLEMCV